MRLLYGGCAVRADRCEIEIINKLEDFVMVI